MIIQLKNQKEDINKYRFSANRAVALIPNNRQINNIIVFECK